MSLERQIKTSPGRQIGASPGRSNRIYSGRPGDVGRGRPWDVLETNICRLGLLDYDYIKNHYRSIAVDLSTEKELYVDPKTIQQIESVGQLKQTMLILQT